MVSRPLGGGGLLVVSRPLGGGGLLRTTTTEAAEASLRMECVAGVVLLVCSVVCASVSRLYRFFGFLLLLIVTKEEEREHPQDTPDGDPDRLTLGERGREEVRGGDGGRRGETGGGRGCLTRWELNLVCHMSSCWAVRSGTCIPSRSARAST